MSEERVMFLNSESSLRRLRSAEIISSLRLHFYLSIVFTFTMPPFFSSSSNVMEPDINSMIPGSIGYGLGMAI